MQYAKIWIFHERILTGIVGMSSSGLTRVLSVSCANISNVAWGI